jgi:hypothetical protein
VSHAELSPFYNPGLVPLNKFPEANGMHGKPETNSDNKTKAGGTEANSINNKPTSSTIFE